MTRRRDALRAALAAAAGWAALPAVGRAGASAAGATLARPRAMRAELQKAVQAGKALVVMVSLDHCPYCKAVRESHLVPLKAGGQPVIQVDMASPAALTDLRGRPSTHQQVASDLRARLAPTVLFLGADGAAAAAPLEGFSSADFYGAYLEERVKTANQAVAAQCARSCGAGTS